MVDTDKIKQLDIADVIGRYIELKKNGPEYRACCPFHDEKTPSFYVVPDKGFYHCFGCGAHGDVISFVTEYTGCSFKEAAEILGEKKFNGGQPIKKKIERVDPYEGYKPVVSDKQIQPGKPVNVVNPKRDGKVWTITPDAVYDYGIQGYVLRTKVNGKKITPQVRYCEGVGWTLYPFDDDRRPYNLRNNGSQILIVEGEKCVDHLQAVVGEKLNVITWAGGTNAISKTDWSLLVGRSVVLWPDNDEPGYKAMSQLRVVLQPICKSVRTIVPGSEYPEGWDGADKEWDAAELFAWCKDHIGTLPAEFHVEHDPKPEPEPEPEQAQPPSQPPAPPDDDWEQRGGWMIKDKEGKPKACINNAMIMLGYHPEMDGVFAYNEFTKDIDLMRRPPWEVGNASYPRRLTDVDDTRATAWLERHGISLNINTVHNAIVSTAFEFKYNPLQQYIKSLKWDGVERLTTCLVDFFECTDSQYAREISRKFFIGAVARAMKPGCKMDTVLILEGDQGLRKSSAVEMIFGEQFFADELADFGSKDAAMQVQGVWCIELAELATMGRAEARVIKEWIPRRVDRFRPPYGRNLIDAPRQCVFVGTVNPEGGYLKDATGGRRFWPVECRTVNLDLIEQTRDQLWAEAYQAFLAGERWWFNKDEYHIAQAEQELRYDADAWEDLVAKYLNGRYQVTMNDVMYECLDLKTRDQSSQVQLRVKKILTALGWKKRQRRVEGRRQWVYTNEVDGE